MNNSLAVRRLLSATKRQWWIVVQAIVVVAAIAGWTASRAPLEPFQARSSFLVKPVASDGSEQVGDIRTFYLATSRVLKGEGVAGQVATALPQHGLTAAEVVGMSSLSIDVNEGSVSVFVKGEDPLAVTDVANAFGPAYGALTSADRNAALQARATELGAGVEDAKLQYQNTVIQLTAAEASLQDTGTLTADRNFQLQQYTTLSTEYQKILTQIATQPKVVEILESAGTAERPEPPSVPVRTALGALVGLMLGLGIASLREMLDDKLRDSEAAAEAGGTITIAEVPKSTRRLEGTLPVVVEPHKSLAEAVRSLRTTIRFLGVTEPIRSVAVTSPAPGDGKSLIAANLAAAFALAGTRTVLVSGDLRRPSIDPLFSASSELGLSDLLLMLEQRGREGDGERGSIVNGVHAEDYLIDSAVENLRVLPAGTPCPNPAELLGSPHLTGVIKDLAGVADMIIIDCPPTIVADAVVLAKVSDGAILVTSLNRSRKRGISAAADRLSTSRVNLLGIVVNRSSSERKSSYGAYATTYAPQSGGRSNRRFRRS